MSERWRGECKTCEAVIEREEERVVQSIMQGHANQLDHNVTIYRITDSDGPSRTLRCPMCYHQPFQMRYDEENDELVFVCQSCGSDYSFDCVKQKIRGVIEE